MFCIFIKINNYLYRLYYDSRIITYFVKWKLGSKCPWGSLKFSVHTDAVKYFMYLDWKWLYERRVFVQGEKLLYIGKIQWKVREAREKEKGPQSKKPRRLGINVAYTLYTIFFSLKLKVFFCCRLTKVCFTGTLFFFYINELCVWFI